MNPFKNFKTPHGNNPLTHALRMEVYFLTSAIVVFCLGVGATAGGALSLVAAALLWSLLTLVGGTLVTAVTRRSFNLVQTGRLVQYLGFGATSYLALLLVDWVFTTGVVSTAPALAAVVQFGLAFGAATLTGEVPWRNRRWLPVPSKVRR